MCVHYGYSLDSKLPESRAFVFFINPPPSPLACHSALGLTKDLWKEWMDRCNPYMTLGDKKSKYYYYYNLVGAPYQCPQKV